MLGAGLAGSTSRRVSPNLNTSGGSKKQGFSNSVGVSTWGKRAISIHANGQNPSHDFVFCVNQLGGVGAGKSQFRTGSSYAKPDNVRKNGRCCSKLQFM
jgi:hypothetical protein